MGDLSSKLPRQLRKNIYANMFLSRRFSCPVLDPMGVMEISHPNRLEDQFIKGFFGYSDVFLGHS